MNLPNKLTILRIILTFFFILFIFIHGVGAKVIAFVIFLSASLTDILDGYLAKKNNQITDFGRLMDPIADKVLILSALLVFVEMKIIPAWMIVLIIFREIAVTGLRVFALTKAKVISSNESGKHKTVWQSSVIFLIILYIIFNEGGSAIFKFWGEGAKVAYKDTIFVLMFISVVLTLASGVSYFIRNREVYSNAKTR